MYYVYSKRFQPFSKLDEAELDWLLNNINEDDKIIIGIVNYKPLSPDPEDHANNWERFSPKYNPLSYWERYCQIHSYINKRNLWDKIISITPMPRPSTNMKHAGNFLPDKAERIMCISVIHHSEKESDKKNGLFKQEEKICEIPSYTFDTSLRIISPKLTACLMVIGSEAWKDFVNEQVYEHLDALNIEDRFHEPEYSLTRKEAREILKNIYDLTASQEEKLLLYNILKEHIKDIQAPATANLQILQKNDEHDISKKQLKGEIEQLKNTMDNWLPRLRSEVSYERYETFNGWHKALIKYLNELSDANGTIQLDTIRSEFEAISKKWQKVIG
ncbi:MAG: hypothetical protein HDQ88_09960 [Clostridia bacterium]|nr:hypothetical protein [Clostridia bacterium]